MGFYQASLKDESKYVETHATKNAIVKINNNLFKKIFLTHTVAKSLEISNFFEDSDIGG